MKRVFYSILFLIFLNGLISCQKPYINFSAQSNSEFYYTENINNQRTSFLNSDIILPLSLNAEKSLPGTPIGNIIPLKDRIGFATSNGFILTLNADDFKQKAMDRPARGISTSVTYGDNKLYIAAERKKNGFLLYDFNQRSLVFKQEETFSSASPIVLNNDVIHTQTNGVIHSFNKINFTQHWQFDSGEHILNSLAYKDKTLFVGTENGKVFAIDAQNGYKIWQQNVEGTIHANPVIINDKLIVATTFGWIYFLNLNNGAFINKKQFDSSLFTTPSTDGKILLISQPNGMVNALNVENLEFIWNKKLDGPISVAPLILENKIAIGTDKKLFYILDKNNGDILQEQALEGRLRAQPTVYKNGLIIGIEYRKIVHLKAGNL